MQGATVINAETVSFQITDITQNSHSLLPVNRGERTLVMSL
jgi:hypothetical protein